MKNIIIFKKTGLKMLKKVYFAFCIALAGSLLCVGDTAASEQNAPQTIAQIINSYLGMSCTLEQRDIGVFGITPIRRLPKVRDQRQANDDDATLYGNFIDPLPRDINPNATNDYYFNRNLRTLIWKTSNDGIGKHTEFSIQDHTAAMETAIDDALNPSIAAKKQKIAAKKKKSWQLHKFIMGTAVVAGVAKLYSWSKSRQVTK